MRLKKYRTRLAKMIVATVVSTTIWAPALAAEGRGPERIAGTIRDLHAIRTVSSTIDAANRDQNPYGLIIDERPGSATAGDLYVSNFSNAAGVNGAGSTVEHIVGGQPVTYAMGAKGPAALAFAALGPLWIANYGMVGTDGNVQVTKPNGASFAEQGIITSPTVQGPWGQAFAPPFTPTSGSAFGPTFFVTGALNGTVAAMYGFTPPLFSTTTKFAILGSGLAHAGSTASTVQGPQGLAWNANTHTLFVTDTADNSVRAYHWEGPGTPDQGQGALVFARGPLRHPVGLTINPVNGDLLIVNQQDNAVVELRVAVTSGATPHYKARVIGRRVLDPTPVDPKTGAGSALFGIAATKDAAGNLVVYYTDDNTNTVNSLTVK